MARHQGSKVTISLEALGGSPESIAAIKFPAIRRSTGGSRALTDLVRSCCGFFSFRLRADVRGEGRVWLDESSLYFGLGAWTMAHAMEKPG